MNTRPFKTTLLCRSAFVLSLVSAFGATIGNGGQVRVDLDPAKSRVEFTLGDVLHTVHGTFQLKRGNLQLDPGSGKAVGEVVVDTASGDSGNKSRDRRMHNEILLSEKYPEITFRPSRVEGKLNSEGRSQVQVTGTFSLNGADHEITVPADVEVTGTHVSGTVRFQVPYVKWGLKNPSTLLLRVSSQVAIDLHIDGKFAVLPNP
jgi:polyisoprenoid-binding protein YceI